MCRPEGRMDGQLVNYSTTVCARPRRLRFEIEGGFCRTRARTNRVVDRASSSRRRRDARKTAWTESRRESRFARTIHASRKRRTGCPAIRDTRSSPSGLRLLARLLPTATLALSSGQFLSARETTGIKEPLFREWMGGRGWFLAGDRISRIDGFQGNFGVCRRTESFRASCSWI